MAIGKNIKGITIEFSGDTTKLGKAIGEIDKKTRSLDQQLRQVDKSLKFNPGNTELLAQKQQLLGQKVSETKDRLNALKEAQAKLDDDPAVDKTSQDYMELRREIIETESKLSHFEQQLKDLNNIKFEQLGQKVEEVGEKVKTVGDGMTKYITVPITAAAGASVKAFNDVDAGLDIVTQKTGASGAELQNMHDIVKNIAQDVPSDFETIGTAVGEVSTRFGLTGDALEDLSTKFVKFADLNGVDVNTAIDTTQKAMAAFGIEAKDAGGFLDVLNKVGQDTGVDMNQLAQSLVTNAASLQQMGLNSTEAATFVGQLEKSGVDSTKAMAGLNKALKFSAEAGEPLPEVLRRFQEAASGASNEADVLAYASEIFGSKAGPQLAQAAMNGALDFAALADSAEDASGSVEKTFNETLDPADRFQMAMNGLKVTGYEVGAVLLETLSPAIKKLGEFVKGLADKWTSLSPGMQSFILHAAGLLAVIGPVLSVVGRLTMGLGGLIAVAPKIISGFGAIGKAFTALKTVMLGNPWILVAAAAIAAIVLIIKNWDQIKEFFTKLWASVKEIFSTAWEGIKAAVMGVWNGIKAGAEAIWTGIKAFFTTIFGVIKTIFQTYWSIYKKLVIDPIKAAFNFVKNTFTKLHTTLSGIFEKIKTAVGGKFKAIKDAMIAPIEKAKELIKGIIDKIKSFFNFKFKLPHIKLPHFSISPKGWKLSDLLEGVIPSLGIEWYAKGGIFKNPSVIGVGEKGAEAALPLDPFWKKMDKIVEAVEAGGSSSQEVTINVYAQPGMDVKQLAEEVERRIVRTQRKKEAIWA